METETDLTNFRIIEAIPGPALRATDSPGKLGSAVLSDFKLLNEQYLAKGWRLIKIVTHFSEAQDATATMFIIGKPFGVQ